jgi:hypothetical protein
MTKDQRMKKLLIALVATFAVGSVSFANEAAPAKATGDTTAEGSVGAATEATTETKTEEGLKEEEEVGEG